MFYLEWFLISGDYHFNGPHDSWLKLAIEQSMLSVTRLDNAL